MAFCSNYKIPCSYCGKYVKMRDLFYEIYHGKISKCICLECLKLKEILEYDTK